MARLTVGTGPSAHVPDTKALSLRADTSQPFNPAGKTSPKVLVAFSKRILSIFPSLCYNVGYSIAFSILKYSLSIPNLFQDWIIEGC